MSAEPEIGLLLPCNVVVLEDKNNSIVVSFMDSVAVLKITSNPQVVAVAQDVRQRLDGGLRRDVESVLVLVVVIAIVVWIVKRGGK